MAEALALTTHELNYLESLIPFASESELSHIKGLLTGQVSDQASQKAEAMTMDGQTFRDRLLIECEGQLRPMSTVLEDWQRDDFEALDPGWEMVAGLRDNAPYLRAYLERPRGHSKTTDIAVMVLFILFASPKMVSGVAAAGDQKQAALVRDTIAKLSAANDWLYDVIDVQNYRVRNRRTGSTLDVLSSDASTSYGISPDFVIVDELTHWKKQDLWDSLFSASAKRSRCMLVVISNAGTGQGLSWQWNIREACRTSELWYFSRVDGPQASWIDAKWLGEQRSMLPSNAYQRLWLNKWVRDSGEGLEWSDVEAACTLDGPQSPVEGLHYIASLDIGLRNDHSALAVLGIYIARQRFSLVHLKWWSPEQYGGQIRLSDVRDYCIQLHSQYRFLGFVYDAYQAVQIVEDLSQHAAALASRTNAPPLALLEFHFNTEGMSRMAECLLQVFRNRQLDIYREPALLDDLMRLQIEERPIGYKLTARRDEKGHADRAIALAMTLPSAIDWAKEMFYGQDGNDDFGESLI
jgi:hypothetical protein